MKINESAPRQLPLSVRLDDSATFNNFFIGSSESGIANRHILEVLKSTQQGDLLYLWGDQGSGCSHLLQACCHWFPQQSIYLPLDQFIDEAPVDVLNGLELMPMVILDGLNAVANKADWAEQLFHLYNRIQDNKGTLIVSASSPPASLETPLADLKSRLSAMQIHKIEVLEDEDKASALIHRAANRGMHMPDKVAQYLLTRYSRDMTEQIDLLEQLDRGSLEAQRKLSIPLVKQILETNNL